MMTMMMMMMSTVLVADCCSGEGDVRRPGGRRAEDTGGVDGSGAAERRAGRAAGRRPAQVSRSCLLTCRLLSEHSRLARKPPRRTRYMSRNLSPVLRTP